MFKIHDFSNNKFDQWLPWGGITYESMVRNKDDSILAVIQYDPLPVKHKHFSKNDFPEFPKGWSLWFDRCHTKENDALYIVICWNPFRDRRHNNTNVLHPKLSVQNNDEAYFMAEITGFIKQLRRYTKCRLLNYQEIYDYFSFVISIGTKTVQMPEVPMYMDVDFSSFVKVEFLSNGITIDDKRIVMLNLPSVPTDELYKFFSFFEEINYRYVRRMLTMTRQDAEKEMSEYTKKWCPGRTSIKDAIMDGILSEFNGYFYNAFIFCIEKDEYTEFIKLLRKASAKLSLAYVLENYNLKDAWWGCVPGCFAANITPPVIGFESLAELLLYEEVE